MWKPTVHFQEADTSFLGFLKPLDHEISPFPFFGSHLKELVFYTVCLGRMLAFRIKSGLTANIQGLPGSVLRSPPSLMSQTPASTYPGGVTPLPSHPPTPPQHLTVCPSVLGCGDLWAVTWRGNKDWRTMSETQYNTVSIWENVKNTRLVTWLRWKWEWWLCD